MIFLVFRFFDFDSLILASGAKIDKKNAMDMQNGIYKNKGSNGLALTFPFQTNVF